MGWAPLRDAPPPNPLQCSHPEILCLSPRRVFLGKFLWWNPRGPPTPQTPLPVLPPRQKGCQSAPFYKLHPSVPHQDLKVKCCRVMGQTLRYGRPCTHDLPGTHNWLAQPHIAFISSDLYRLSHAGTSLEVWSELLLHWLDSPHCLQPSACASDF